MPAVRFRMRPEDDLSVRSDFPMAIMRKMAADLQSKVDGAEELAELRKKVRIDVRAVPSLRKIDISVALSPIQQGVSDDDLKKARESVNAVIRQSTKTAISGAFQGAISDVRGKS